MLAALLMVIMSSSFLVPGFALSSHFDLDGAPLSGMSWPSSLAVVAVSFSGLFTFVFLMLACLCCKKGHIGFKEFENADGEEYQADLSTLASTASQSGPDVYILPLTEVSLPLAKQPGRSVQLLKSTEVGRQSLLYLKEIGDGWFGKVLLGEVNAGLSSTQVVVKELKASASVQDQMHFLEESQPYRALQHPALLHCLAQCTEVTPYLLVMEFCPLGDVKGYLASDTMTPEPLILQRMACEIASGLLHLHKHNFIHSDLALRNCLLTADVTVKIGDYGLSHNKYKEDYFEMSDQMYVPLRWIAPELIDEVHGNLLVVDQSKQSNVWSLGVTIWELFELGNQPYRQYSDRQVLTYAMREQQLKLPKPLLKIPLAERWYEVMQFCWLQPDQRPNTEEVHLLLSYLCAKGASEAEEDFERRWNSLRPNPNADQRSSSLHHGAGALATGLPSSFPLLEQFSGCDGYHSESGDDILTVTETSHGLNFQYKWEQTQAGIGAEQPYHHAASSSSGTLGVVNHHCQDLYYPGGMVGGSGGVEMEGLTLGVSPSYYEHKTLHVSGVGVVPVLRARSPSVSSEYYIRMEEPGVDYTMYSYSPDYQGSHGSFLTSSGSADSGECMMGMGPPQAHSKPVDWSADVCKDGGVGAYNSDISLTTEPHVSDSSPMRPWEAGHYVSYKDQDGGYYYEHSPPMGIGHHMGLGMDQHDLMGREHSPPKPHLESWGSRSLRQALGELDNPLGISPSISTHLQDGGPLFGVGDPYLETTQGPGSVIGGSSVTGGYYDMMGSLRKTMPTMPDHAHSVSITMASEEALFICHRDNDSDEEEDIFSERLRSSSSNLSNPSANNNSLGLGLSLGRSGQAGCRQLQDLYEDFHYTMPTTDIEDSWPEEHCLTFHSSVSAAVKPIDYLEATAPSANDSGCLVLGNHHALVTSGDACNTYIYLCHEGKGERDEEPPPIECCHSHFVDPLTGLVVRNYTRDDYGDKIVEIPNNEEESVNLSPAPGGPKPILTSNTKTSTTPLNHSEQYVDITMDNTVSIDHKEEVSTEDKGVLTDPKPEGVNVPDLVPMVEQESELSHTLDSCLDRDHCSSISLVDISDCCTDDDEDDDITDSTSEIFADETSVGDPNASPLLARPLKSLQKQVGTPNSMASMDLMPSAVGSTCEAFSPSSSSSHPSSSSPKAMDSGYDTENNESPEFVPKEPHNEPRGPETFTQPLGESVLDTSLDEEGEEGGEEAEVAPLDDEDEPTLDEDVPLAASQTTDKEKGLTPLSEKNPYRDSAYFSDNENERLYRDEGGDKVGRDESGGVEEGEVEERLTEKRELSPLQIEEEDEEEVETSALLLEESEDPEMEACLTEEFTQDEGLELGLELELASILSGEVEAGSEGWPAQEKPSSLGDWAAEVVGAMEEALGELQRSSSTETNSGTKEEEEEGEQRDMEYSSEALETVDVLEEAFTKMPETLEKDDNDEENSPPARRRRFSFSPPPPSTPPLSSPLPPSTPSPPLPPMTPPLGWELPMDWMEADKEDVDGDSDDSESDEEQSSYSVQEEQSGGEESGEENHAVPIVLSDCSDAHNLRSLLKMPTPLTTELLADDLLERKKKVVSFFDDVTIYLFDQSPTKELAEHGFSPGAETSGQGSLFKQPTSDSSDGNISQESAGYEWEDDFPLLPTPTSSSKMAASSSCLSPSVPSLPFTSKAPEPKPAVRYSRFTVSPSHVSRFSITHVSDSDVDSGPGSSEDGDRVL